MRRAILIVGVLLCLAVICARRSAVNAPVHSSAPILPIVPIIKTTTTGRDARATTQPRIVAVSDGFALEGVKEDTRTGPGWRNPAKPVLPHFPKSFDGTLRVRSGVADVGATPLGAKPSPGKIAADGSLVYENAFDGCDVKYRCSALKTEEFLIVHDEHAQQQWSWDLDLNKSELKPRLTPMHTIELCDNKGVPRLRINAPEGKDAAGKRLTAGERLKFRIDGTRVTLSLDAQGLKFPLTIDPSWSSTGAMNETREFFSATLLNSGKVLVAGGENNVTTSTGLSSCEIYDPTSNTWSATNSMSIDRASHQAVKLSDGTVLVASGHSDNTMTFLQSSEVYDETLGTWSSSGSMNAARVLFTLTLLGDGSVLAAGGSGNGSTELTSSEIFNSGTWTNTTGAMNFARREHTATLLQDGRVLVAGRYQGTANSEADRILCEIFDPTTGLWTSTTSLNGGLVDGSAVRLGDGRVFVSTDDLGSFEIFNPSNLAWTSFNTSLTGNANGAVLLNNGKVLLAVSGLPIASPSSVLFNPADNSTISVGNGSGNGAAVVHFSDDRVLTIGSNGATLFDPHSVAVSQTLSIHTHTNQPVTLTADTLNSPATFTVQTNPTNGLLSGSAPTLSYVSNAGFVGTDSFTFTVSDAFYGAGTNTATVTINVTDTAPVASSQTISTHSNTPLSITLGATDADNDPLTFSFTQPLHGTVIAVTTNGNIVYTPATAYVGSDSFTFKANDGALDSNIATVTINVTDTAPVSSSQAVSTHFNTPLNITLGAIDADNDPLTYAVGQPSHGTLSGTAPNLTYTPATAYVGPDSLTFSVNDGALDSNIATVTLNVTDTAPTVTAAASPTILIEGNSTSFTATGSDADGDPLTYSWNFGDGSTSTSQNPSHTYSSAGTYTATVTVSDGALTASASVVINVYHNSDRPTARFVASDLTGYVGQPVGFDATFSTDPQNNIVTYQWDFGDGSPFGSTQAISRAYTAEGTYLVTLTIADGRGLMDTTSMTMVILPAADSGLFSSAVKYSTSWNRKTTNSDALNLVAQLNAGTTSVSVGTPLSLDIVGQTFTGSTAAARGAGSSALTNPDAKFSLKPGKKGSPKGTVELKVSIRHANLGAGFAQAGATGGKSAALKIPVRLGIGASSFSSGVNSSFRFGSNGTRGSGSGQGN